MAYEIVFLLGADIDFLEAYGFYGDPLHDRVHEMLGLLQDNPFLGSQRIEGFRRILVPRSPYGLFYTIEGNRIFVVALQDLRQDPERIRRRLRGLT